MMVNRTISHFMLICCFSAGIMNPKWAIMQYVSDTPEHPRLRPSLKWQTDLGSFHVKGDIWLERYSQQFLFRLKFRGNPVGSDGRTNSNVVNGTVDLPDDAYWNITDYSYPDNEGQDGELHYHERISIIPSLLYSRGVRNVANSFGVRDVMIELKTNAQNRYAFHKKLGEASKMNSVGRPLRGASALAGDH